LAQCPIEGTRSLTAARNDGASRTRRRAWMSVSWPCVVQGSSDLLQAATVAWPSASGAPQRGRHEDPLPCVRWSCPAWAGSEAASRGEGQGQGEGEGSAQSGSGTEGPCGAPCCGAEGSGGHGGTKGSSGASSAGGVCCCAAGGRGGCGAARFAHRRGRAGADCRLGAEHSGSGCPYSRAGGASACRTADCCWKQLQPSRGSGRPTRVPSALGALEGGLERGACRARADERSSCPAGGWPARVLLERLGAASCCGSGVSAQPGSQGCKPGARKAWGARGAGAERRRESDGRDVGEVRARADAHRLPHAGRAGGHGGVPRGPLPAGGRGSSPAVPGALAGGRRGTPVMQVAWRWTNGRLAEAPIPPTAEPP
jgi:hypothetical protein